jgi:hypothetical protein
VWIRVRWRTLFDCPYFHIWMFSCHACTPLPAGTPDMNYRYAVYHIDVSMNVIYLLSAIMNSIDCFAFGLVTSSPCHCQDLASRNILTFLEFAFCQTLERFLTHHKRWLLRNYTKTKPPAVLAATPSSYIELPKAFKSIFPSDYHLTVWLKHGSLA